MVTAFVALLVMQLLVPLLLVRRMWTAPDWTPRDWILTFLLGATYMAFIGILTPWGHAPYAFRIIWPVLYGAAAIRALVRMRRASDAKTRIEAAAAAPPHEPASGETDPADTAAGAESSAPLAAPGATRVSLIWTLLPALFFAFQCARALEGYRCPPGALELAFPLRNGAYVVGQGGNHPSINYHNVVDTQKYALDIAALNAVGLRSSGIAPRQLERYVIFGHTLHSPCDATVRSVVDGLPDQIPPASDPDNPAGNHVELETGGTRIFLAHMKRGSIRVKKGDRVSAGDPLGQVGNSGNTTEPHLHIHAVRGGKGLWEGEGVPLTFGGRFLVRNNLVSQRLP